MNHTLTCPGCGEETLHHFEVVVFDRPDDADTTYVTLVCGRFVHSYQAASEAVPNPSLRRGGVLIRFRCECCPCVSVFRLAQHKGASLIAFEKANNQENELPVPDRWEG